MGILMDKCLRHCTTQSSNNSTELQIEKIHRMVSEICIPAGGSNGQPWESHIRGYPAKRALNRSLATEVSVDKRMASVPI